MPRQQDDEASSLLQYLRQAQIWPESLVGTAKVQGLRMSREDVANLPTLEDLFALVRFEAACPNPHKASESPYLQPEEKGGGMKSRQQLLEPIAAGRSAISHEPPQPGPHPVIVVTLGRHVMFYPTSQHRPGNEPSAILTGDVSSLMDTDASGDGSSNWTALLRPRGASTCDIAVIACTWGLFLNMREGKDYFDAVRESIPFFNSLLDLAHYGHNVWVFDSHPLTLPAGCRNADALLVDPKALLLPEGWTNVADQVMRGREMLFREGDVAQAPIWFYNEADGSFQSLVNMTPGHPCDGFQGSVAEWIADYSPPASMGD